MTANEYLGCAFHLYILIANMIHVHYKNSNNMWVCSIKAENLPLLLFSFSSLTPKIMPIPGNNCQQFRVYISTCVFDSCVHVYKYVFTHPTILTYIHNGFSFTNGIILHISLVFNLNILRLSFIVTNDKCNIYYYCQVLVSGVS